VDWNLAIDEAELAALMPGEYARFAAPVKAGLVVFLRGLPEPRQRAIVAEQVALGITAPLSQRLGRLAHACPVLHKLGQVLARDQRLAPELRAHLRELESLPPTAPWESVQSALAQQLGPRLREVTLVQPALAEASVAIVVAFTEDDGDRRAGVFKLLKAGIVERLHEELTLLGCVGAHLDERCVELGLAALDYREAFHQVRDKLAAEVLLANEQLHLKAAERLYADDRDIVVPAVFAEYCTPRLTAMQRVFGVKITDDHRHSAEKRRLATIVARALASRPLFSRSDDGLFHCDPHAGNLMATADGRAAILDWSLVARLSANVVETVVQCLLVAITFDARKLACAVSKLAHHGKPDPEALHAAATRALVRARRGALPGLTWFIGLLDDATQTAHLRVSPELMLMRKALLTLEGVLAELGLNGDELDALLLTEFLIHFAGEWPRRWLSAPQSRAFATRLSNADLWRLLAAWPTTAMRWATGAFG
jgi:ubiquinone biosynthesis protein